MNIPLIKHIRIGESSRCWTSRDKDTPIVSLQLLDQEGGVITELDLADLAKALAPYFQLTVKDNT